MFYPERFDFIFCLIFLFLFYVVWKEISFLAYRFLVKRWKTFMINNLRKRVKADD